MEIEDELIEKLSLLNYPVIRQGSLSPEDVYPDTFITFWNTSEVGGNFYNNKIFKESYGFAIYVYSNLPENTYSVLRQIRDLLCDGEWIITQRGFDVASDEITHTGRGMNVVKLKFNK